MERPQKTDLSGVSEVLFIFNFYYYLLSFFFHSWESRKVKFARRRWGKGIMGERVKQHAEREKCKKFYIHTLHIYIYIHTYGKYIHTYVQV